MSEQTKTTQQNAQSDWQEGVQAKTKAYGFVGHKRKNAWRKAFLEAFRITGIITTAAKAVGVSRAAVEQASRRDPEFKTAMQAAAEEAADNLEAVAIGRATASKSPSDLLLMFMLKSRRPEKFRDNYRMEMSGPNGGAIPIYTDGETRVIVLPSNGFEGGAATATREQRLEALTFEEPKAAMITEGA